MEEFRCFFCGEKADRLSFYSKDYPSGLSSIEKPYLICSGCYKKPNIRDKIHQHRGGIEGLTSYTFEQIAKFPTKRIGYLLSGKPYEINHLSNTFWRKMIFRVHYTNQPGKGKSELSKTL